eukprot:gene18776-14341_t
MNYVGEEDWGATSTGVLAHYAISRSAIGLDDVVVLLQNGDRLHVSKVFGRPKAVLCVVCPPVDGAENAGVH